MILGFLSQALGPEIGLAAVLVKMNYGLPVIRRRGLGNELFAWARCVVWCRKANATMFRARWRQVHIGPYLRSEGDKRQYHQLFRASYGESWTRLPWLIAKGYRFKREDEELGSSRGDRSIVTFDGMRDCFSSLHTDHYVINSELIRAAKPGIVASLPALPNPHLGVHVRCGDFAIGTEKQLVDGAMNMRVPVSWYIAAIDAVRETVGPLPVCLYTDGTNDELSALLRMSGVQRIAGNALSDILALSQASILIASGSTFSSWASFLNQTPTIHHRGQNHYPTRAPSQSEVEWMPGERLAIDLSAMSGTA